MTVADLMRAAGEAASAARRVHWSTFPAPTSPAEVTERAQARTDFDMAIVTMRTHAIDPAVASTRIGRAALYALDIVEQWRSAGLSAAVDDARIDRWLAVALLRQVQRNEVGL